jgi:uncharacterized protein
MNKIIPFKWQNAANISASGGSTFNIRFSQSGLMLDTIKEVAHNYFQSARGSHNWDHTIRVCRLCERLGSAEGVDLDVLLAAAFLHDIGRSLQDDSNGAVCHAETGARMAASIIAKLSFSQGQKENILHCIRAHRFRSDCPPRTPEAKVLFDADKLDAIGAVGVARAFLFAGEVGARLHNGEIGIEDSRPYSIDDTGYREFKVKLCKIKDRMQTKEGLKLADERHAFMEKFFNRFIEENEGKR